MSGRHLKTLAIIFALAGVYVAAGRFGLSLAFLNSRASAVWPPTGLALAALLIFGNRLWPGITIGAFVVNLTARAPGSVTYELVWVSLVIAAGNTLEALTGAWLARKFAGGLQAFERARDVFRFTLLAVIPSTLISASIGVAGLLAAGLASRQDMVQIWLTWWVGDLVSDLVIAPLLITWVMPARRSMNVRRWIEAGALLLFLLFVGEVIFGGAIFFDLHQYPLAYFAMPVLIWAAYRFHQRGAAVGAFAIGMLVVLATLRGNGPFALHNVNQSMLLLGAFIAAHALTSLTVAALVDERVRIEADREVILLRERAARHEAERANRAKDEFLGILSHELRTPLAPVLLTASMLENDKKLPVQARQDANLIRRNVELEARLIDDLLDVTRVSHGKLALDLRPTNVHMAMKRAADICCSHRAADLTMEFGAQRHFMRADPARLQQVFWNLFNNAAKFTPAGKKISVRSASVDDRLRIEIVDEGIGIEKQNLSRLFEAFEQGDPSRTKAFGGLGLGLAITKALVEAHGGRITAESDGRDKGAKFTLEFPTIDAPIQNENPDSTQPAVGSMRRSLRVLVVEDNDPTRQVMSRLLGSQGHSVTTAENVRTALEHSQRTDYDLVISDIGLPDGTGYDLMKQALEIAATRNHKLKGIAISGYGRDEDIRMSREAGFAQHLTKPVDMDELSAVIEKMAAQ
jgi:signal transduction histidine kinase/ActR/RegA family two-component response regulator